MADGDNPETGDPYGGRGKEWFDALPNERKWGLGDVLVLGDFDWRYWGFDHRPTRAFLLGADAARINWEVQGV